MPFPHMPWPHMPYANLRLHGKQGTMYVAAPQAWRPKKRHFLGPVSIQLISNRWLQHPRRLGANSDLSSKRAVSPLEPLRGFQHPRSGVELCSVRAQVSDARTPELKA